MPKPSIPAALAMTLLSLAAPTPGFAQTPPQHSPPAATVPVVRKAVERHIRPAYRRLEDMTARLRDAATAFCAAPSPAARKALDGAFEGALIAWAGAEHIRFGPAAAGNLYDRFAFWPDEKGLGLKQINAALQNRDASVAEAASLRGKSVALQGFTALEFLLYGAGAESLSQPGEAGAFRCRFAAAIAENLAAMSAEIRAAWEDEAGFAATLYHPDAAHPLYKSGRDVKLELFKVFVTGLQHLRDAKLARVIGDSPETARPRRAAYWRSGLSFKVIAANIDALENYFTDGGFQDMLARVDPAAVASVLSDFGTMKGNIAAVTEQDVAASIASKTGWNRLNGIIFELITVQQTGGSAIAKASDLSLGFNALDGD